MNVPLDTADRAADVLIAFRQSGVAITSVSVDRPTLDEVFFAITGHGADADGHPGPAGTGTSEADADHKTVLEVQ
jgi:ABC-2 type transport system ATP-binding protein